MVYAPLDFALFARTIENGLAAASGSTNHELSEKSRVVTRAIDVAADRRPPRWGRPNSECNEAASAHAVCNIEVFNSI